MAITTSSTAINLIIGLLLPFHSAGFRVAHCGGGRRLYALRSMQPRTAIASLSAAASDSAASTGGDSDGETDSSLPKKKAPPNPRKSHCTTICAVPPPSATEAWEALSRARKELRDPGFYRWPPHANLIYPFLELNSMKKRKENVNGASDEEREPLFEEDMLEALSNATAQVELFEVTISEMGTFGGKSRGVLWAYPRSRRLGADDGADEDRKEQKTPTEFCRPSEPMIQLQALLEREFPTCTEQRKQRQFHPHITLSHYASLDDASTAKEQIEKWWAPIAYTTSEIYVLRRVGDEGQFEIAATVPLGSRTAEPIAIHDPPIQFPGQPKAEEEWVYEERMALKARRINNGGYRYRKRAGRKRRNGRNRGPRIPDTPEIIEAKRAARKAKREALEREALEQAATESTNDT